MRSYIARAFFLMLFALSTGLYAYTFSHTENGKVQRWNSSDLKVTYYINQSGYSKIDNTSLINIIQGCFNSWQNNPLCALSFNYMGTTSKASIGSDGYNLMIFDSKTSDGFLVAEKAGSSTIGLTWRTFYVETGEIADADIIFNEQFTFSATEKTNLANKLINLKDVLTHEIGHLVGLNHTYIEEATMWPYAADGQATLASDDSAGAGALYPASTFLTSRDSITGVVRDFDGNPVFGVHVSAIPAGSTAEAVSALSLEGGRYTISGLAKNMSYRLRARSVDLTHLDTFEETRGSTEVFIPQYYNGVNILDQAQSVAAGSKGIDFSMSVATTWARYDINASLTTIFMISPPVNPATESQYFAVKFPKSELWPAFMVFGMKFWNNDKDTPWPRIMLCEDASGKPNLQNVLREVRNYEGKDWNYSLVEWEPITLTNSKDIWVVFQMPNKTFVGQYDGPALGGENVGTYYNSLYYSVDGGKTFPKYSAGSYAIDPIVSLTVAQTTAPIPVAQLESTNIDFGVTKVKQTRLYPLKVSNPGTGELKVGNPITSSDFSKAITAYMNDYSVPAGGVDSIIVSFYPKVTYATYNAQLSLTTNDPAREALQVMVKGRGAYPKAQVPAASLDFGTVDAGQSLTRGLTIKSTGEVSLYAFKFSVASGPFQVLQSDTLRIAAGDSAVLAVRFSPVASGAAAGTLSFSVDDTLNTAFSISLTGTGSGGAAQKSCDFTGDSRAGLSDLLAFLLLARSSPSDPRLDWNGDGAYSLADALALAADIRAGNCPGISLAAASGKDDVVFLASLSHAEKEYLGRLLDELGLSAEEREALAAMLDGFTGQAQLPRAFDLAQNTPNPFNPRTAITFSVPEGGGAVPLSLVVFDIRGQLVRTLVSGPREPGNHTVYWEGEDESGRKAPSGIYFYRMRVDGKAFTRKMVLIK